MGDSAEKGTIRKPAVFAIKLTVAALLIAMLFKSTGLSSILDNLCRIRPAWGLATIMALMFLLLMGAFNVWLLLQSMQKVRFGAFLKPYFCAWSAGLLTPGQLGDASLAYFLKQQGIPLRFGATSYLVDKLLTVAVLCWVGWHGMTILIPEAESEWFLIVPYGTIVLIFLLLAAVRFCPAHTGVLGWLHGRLNDLLNEFSLLKQRKRIILFNIFITIGKWLVMSLCYMTAFLAFGHYITWPIIGIIPVLATLVGYIPITIGGIGSVEYTAIYLFSMQGIESSVVFSVYIFMRTLQYIIASVLLVIFWCFNRRTITSDSHM